MDYNELLLKADFVIDGRVSLPHQTSKKWAQRDPKVIKGVVYHQSLDDYGTASGNAKYHTGPNHISQKGLPGLSYTLFADRKLGKLVLANSVECITYSQGNKNIPGDENELYLSVCFGGNFKAPGYSPPGNMKLTKEQKSLAVQGWEYLQEIFGFQSSQLYGHYHFGKAACPGNELMEFIENIRGLHYREVNLWGLKEHNITFESNVDRQTCLERLGHYHGKIDGNWGPLSKYALSQFQAAVPLPTDGVWGPRVEEAITEALK